jgi:F0F1-type ATP synthase membrane subunit c/vacuolar-type H+-ATPase subunit K
MVWFVPALAVGLAFTVSVIEEVAVQPFESVTVTVYVVVAIGEAVGLAVVGPVRPVVGLQP